ncbi:glutathione S-transferase family protein [Mesorhizobium xinjiangense]|uniref:glutathione S-transferase family protein n=1 Tax=Mesorhizobium xinjiangense TaxID=2678685 RepID=UPI0012EE3063|nr:glutathione S-transferase family protein [Mesorhizobium xinjiangense]
MRIQLYDLIGTDPSRPFSPHCWKVAMALGHKGIDFERVPVCYTQIPQVEDGISRTLPVIRDGERAVADSFDIALYLEETYPDRPTLFGGEGGWATARFVERWSQSILHPYISKAALIDIHEFLAPADQAHFRASREARFGMRLEDVPGDREAGLDAFRKSLEPLRSMLGFQPFIGGAGPLFADYIVFGAFQWARIVSDWPFLEADDPVGGWFERCLDLYDGLGQRVATA